MNKTIRIAIVNHSFQKEFFRTRWVKFAKKYPDCEIFLITPSAYIWGRSKALTYGSEEKVEAESFNDNNFHLISVRSNDCLTGGWKSKDFKTVLKHINPDFIYHIGTHTQNPLFQIIDIKRRYHKNAQLLSFSMRGINTNKTSRISLMKYDKNIFKKILRIPMYILDLIRLKKVNKYVDCILCHYPDAKRIFEAEGFKRKISVQTQVGVNTDIFKPNDTYRQEIRTKYNLGDSFVFGSASRFHYSKGILQILDSLTFDGDWKYLLMGSGLPDERKLIEEKIKQNGLENKVILTGYIDVSEMPKYWNAIDCAIHFPISTPQWIETFSLALVQAMATEKAVVGSSSGSVPFQIGDDGCVVEEGNSRLLSLALKKMMEDDNYRTQNAKKMYERAVSLFSVDSLNKQFYELIKDLYVEK